MEFSASRATVYGSTAGDGVVAVWSAIQMVCVTEFPVARSVQVTEYQPPGVGPPGATPPSSFNTRAVSVHSGWAGPDPGRPDPPGIDGAPPPDRPPVAPTVTVPVPLSLPDVAAWAVPSDQATNETNVVTATSALRIAGTDPPLSPGISRTRRTDIQAFHRQRTIRVVVGARNESCSTTATSSVGFDAGGPDRHRSLVWKG